MHIIHYCPVSLGVPIPIAGGTPGGVVVLYNSVVILYHDIFLAYSVLIHSICLIVRALPPGFPHCPPVDPPLQIDVRRSSHIVILIVTACYS